MEKRRLSTLLSKRASYIDSVVSDYVTVARQAPLSTGFSRQEHWSGLPCPPQANLPDPGIKPTSLCLLRWRACSLPLVPPGKPS